ncbi:uncharacterized protein LOC118408285 [Branchiostoma floridae]|uniref:Uncharacterized protein LOC118408285 n=2 Tax=Branchiostoma floridae TaxID=7739 RepID=A0A9J7KIE9_BRAFL|nr:uncharacterized protein LOC118408285 [Branchiostoma floridae]
MKQLTLTAQDIHGILLRSPYDKEHQALQALELWRDRRGKKACKVKLADALRKGGFQQTADELHRYDGQEVNISAKKPTYVTDGIERRNSNEQETGKIGTRTQQAKSRTSKSSEPTATTSLPGQYHEPSTSTSREESKFHKEFPSMQQSDVKDKKQRKRKKIRNRGNHTQSKAARLQAKIKPEPEARGKLVSVKDEKGKKGTHDLPHDKNTIYHTVLETGERIFDKKTVQDYDEFDRCVKSFEPIAAAVPDDEVREILQSKLQTWVKLRIKVRVREKIAEVAQILFRDKVLDPKNKEFYYKMADCFARFQAALIKAERGCVFCHLDFPDAGCYDTFWHGYCDGSLSDTLTQELITDDMRAAEGGADLYIDVRVSYSATGEDDFQDQDPSGSTGQGSQHPGPSREHPGQGPTAPSSSHGDDDTPLGYHGDDTGDTGRQVSGGEGTIQVKEEPDEQGTGASFMTETIKSEVDTQLYTIADHLGSMWERLATTLGFKTDYIRDLTDRLPPYLRARQLIHDWIERNDGDVTLDQLVQALRDAGIHEVADAVESGQLFAASATFETAKEKRSEDMDTDRPGGDERSNESLSDDTDSESSAPGGFHHGNMAGGAFSVEHERPSLESGSQSITSMYPTGEDALAWNDCLQDFFKTDENTTRIIQESWPSNLLVKHLIRDRFFHSYLCEYWKHYKCFPDTLAAFVEFVTKVCAKHFCLAKLKISDFESIYESHCLVLGKAAYENETKYQQHLVHHNQLEWDDIRRSSFGLLQSVSTGSVSSGSFQFVHDYIRQFLIAMWIAHIFKTKADHEKQFRDFVKKSHSLQLSCYCVAHLLGQSDSHTNLLMQYVDLLIKADTEQGEFDHLLYAVTIAAESKQFDILTPKVKCFFPEKTLDLSSSPEISFHGLHSLKNVISKKSIITKIQLPNNIKSEDLQNMYPFCRRGSPQSISHNHQIRCLSYLLLFPTDTTDVDTLNFKRTDSVLQVKHIQKYLLCSPSLQALSIKKEGINSKAFIEIAQYFLFTPSLTSLAVRCNRIWTQEMKTNARRCLASCRNLKIVKLPYFLVVEMPFQHCLEEIDLSHNYLGREEVPGLAESLGFFQDLKRLDLSYNNLTGSGDFLPALPKLRVINLSHNSLRDKSVSNLADGFRSCQNLKKINLSHNKFSKRGHLLKSLPNLEEIDLSHNALRGEAVPGITEGLGSCRNLMKVNLSHNGFPINEGFLPSLPKLEEIDLSHNDIIDVEVSRIAKGLDLCENLKTVNLTNNKISNKGALLLLLLERCKQLQVDISGNNISDDIVSLLEKRTDASQVVKLHLSAENTEAGVVPLSVATVTLLQEFLPQMSKLEEIDLSGGSIVDAASPCLAEGLASCQNLKKLNLSHNELSCRGDFLPSLPNLEEIDLSHNTINDEAVPGLAKGLGLCPKLNKVDLSFNRLLNKGALLLLLQQTSTQLLKIEIAGNDVSEKLRHLLLNRPRSRTEVKKFDLMHTGILDNVTTFSVTEALILLQFLSQLTNMEELALCVSYQEDRGYEHISQLNEDPHPLKKLRLSLRGWSVGTAMLLTKMFQQFSLLEEVDLSGSDIGDVAVHGLTEALTSCQNLRKVDLSHNRLVDVGALIESFSKLAKLSNVYIDTNAIDDNTLPIIAAWLNHTIAMKEIKLHYNKFSAEGVRDFVEIIKGRAQRLLSDELLYDGTQGVESDGENVWWGEQQLEKLRRERGLIVVKVGQLTVRISHEGNRS